MIREMIIPKECEYTIKLPESYLNKEVEILIFPVNESSVIRDKSFNPSKYRGVINIPEEKLNEEIKGIRKEWDRI